MTTFLFFCYVIFHAEKMYIFVCSSGKGEIQLFLKAKPDLAVCSVKIVHTKIMNEVAKRERKAKDI